MRGRHSFLMAALVVVALAIALTVIATAGHDSLALNGIIYVDADALEDGNDGTSWEHAFTTLQPALYTAGTGTQIWVAEGTYKPTSGTDRTASFQMKNGVAIYGGFDPTLGVIDFGDRNSDLYKTILSGDLNGDDGENFAHNEENSYHVFFHPAGTDLDSTAILDGFTITGGNASAEFGSNSSGGGMYSYGSSPTLTNCTFLGNSASFGGGMYNTDGSSPALTDCTFEGNSGGTGGGMYNHDDSSPTLTNCTFESNSANIAGGMMNYENCAPELTHCIFEGNSAGFAGGMQNYNSSPVLSDCTFRSNSASGPVGGLSNMSSSPVLTNCIFEGNSAYNWGGGMSNSDSSPTLTNCIFYGNSASRGGGINNDVSSPVVTNCILWGDTPQEIYNTGDTSLPVITYSDIQGGYDGVGNIDSYPFFADPANGDFHLRACSRCIDAGNDLAPNLPDYDFEGDDRILDGDGDGTPTVDMGVDEVVDGLPCLQLYLPLVLRNY